MGARRTDQSRPNLSSGSGERLFAVPQPSGLRAARRRPSPRRSNGLILSRSTHRRNQLVARVDTPISDGFVFSKVRSGPLIRARPGAMVDVSTASPSTASHSRRVRLARAARKEEPCSATLAKIAHASRSGRRRVIFGNDEMPSFLFRQVELRPILSSTGQRPAD